MTRLFVRFYLGVLVVLFLAWWINGYVLRQRAAADRARVFVAAHAGGARLMSRVLSDATDPHARLKQIEGQFEYPALIVSRSDLPASAQRRLSAPDDVHYIAEENSIVTPITDEEVVWLGPFPDYTVDAIEDAIEGWMKLTAQTIDDCEPEERPASIDALRARFEFPISVVSLAELPEEPRVRVTEKGDGVAFFGLAEDGFFAVTPLKNGTEGVVGGPFPSFENNDQNAATTTLALVLLPAALAIAVLLRPVAQQLRRLENAAKSIAAGDLSARVDERRVSSAKPLAIAFNEMAGRTETLVRTQRELLQAVSHELRTPLSRIRFAVDLIESSQSDDERKQRLNSLDAAAEELDELVGELLRYVRLESANPELDREYLAIDETLNELIAKYSGLYPEITFHQSNAAAKNSVFADRAGFHRVVGNLLSNAGRFAKSSVSITSHANSHATIIDVDDDGIGILESDRSRVLEPFVRLDDQPENGRGVGLGLALVRRIMERHGGQVEISESPQGGCRVRTVWPSDAAARTEAQAS